MSPIHRVWIHLRSSHCCHPNNVHDPLGCESSATPARTTRKKCSKFSAGSHTSWRLSYKALPEPPTLALAQNLPMMEKISSPGISHPPCMRRVAPRETRRCHESSSRDGVSSYEPVWGRTLPCNCKDQNRRSTTRASCLPQSFRRPSTNHHQLKFPRKKNRRSCPRMTIPDRCTSRRRASIRYGHCAFSLAALASLF